MWRRGLRCQVAAPRRTSVSASASPVAPYFLGVSCFRAPYGVRSYPLWVGFIRRRMLGYSSIVCRLLDGCTKSQIFLEDVRHRRDCLRGRSRSLMSFSIAVPLSRMQRPRPGGVKIRVSPGLTSENCARGSRAGSRGLARQRRATGHTSDMNTPDPKRPLRHPYLTDATGQATSAELWLTNCRIHNPSFDDRSQARDLFHLPG